MVDLIVAIGLSMRNHWIYWWLFKVKFLRGKSMQPLKISWVCMPTLQEMLGSYKQFNGAVGAVVFNNIKGCLLSNIYVMVIITVLYWAFTIHLLVPRNNNHGFSEAENYHLNPPPVEEEHWRTLYQCKGRLWRKERWWF